jgi:hypothetical protein
MPPSKFDLQAAVLAAVAGIALGATACKEKSHSEAAPANAAPTPAGSAAKACCKGLNDCKGKGGCAVDGKHECAGKNDCKGKGGCDMHCPK